MKISTTNIANTRYEMLLLALLHPTITAKWGVVHFGVPTYSVWICARAIETGDGEPAVTTTSTWMALSLSEACIKMDFDHLDTWKSKDHWIDEHSGL